MKVTTNYWFRQILYICAWTLGTWVASEFLHYWLRLPIIVLGFAAMWSLWVAREQRGDNWTDKTKEIWLCHMLFMIASIMGNIQLFYRQSDPTFGVLLVTYIFVLTIKGAFNNDTRFTINYTGLYTKKP